MCSLFVIYIHALNLGKYGIDENSVGIGHITYVIETYAGYIIGIAVPMFYFIFAILFFRTFELRNLLKKWKTRVFTILIPYLIWCCLHYLYFVVCTKIDADSNMVYYEKVELSVFAWIKALWIEQFSVLGFLKLLMVFILLSPIIWMILKNHCKKVPTGFFALIVLLLLYKRMEILHIRGISDYLVGSYIGINCQEYIKKKNPAVSIISLIFILFVLLTSFRYWNFIVMMMFFVAIWYAMDLIDLSEINLPWWTHITFFTYVAHCVLLETFEKIVLVIGGKNPAWALADFVFMPLVIEALLILVAYFLRNKLPTIWGVITGHR